jgi:hypothetical protein
MMSSRFKPIAVRQNRSLGNAAWHALNAAEPAWLRFVEMIEAMAGLRGDDEIGTKARDVAQQMHELREVLRSWRES